MSLEGCAPFLLLLSPFSARLVLSCQQEGAARSHKAGGCSIFNPPHSELHWGATVSLEASRLLPSRLVGFPLPPPTFNHLFTAVTQRKASPGGNTPNRLELGLFGEFLGRGANQQGGEVGSLAGEDALQLRFFCRTRIFEERQQRRKPLGCPIVNRRNPPHPLPIFALTLTDQHSFLDSLRIPFACWGGVLVSRPTQYFFHHCMSCTAETHC